MKTLLIAALLALTFSAEARTFKNLKGQSIDGALTKADAATAEILLATGRIVKVPLDTLSEADRQFCNEWRAANPEIKLSVKAEGVTATGSRQSSTAQSGGTSSSVSEKTRTVEEGYRLLISNWSKDPGAKLSGLTIDYALVVGYFDSTAKDKRGVKEVVRGSVEVPELSGSRPAAVLTKTVRTGQTTSVSSRTTQNSSGERSTSVSGTNRRESLDGITLVVRQGTRTVHSYTLGKVPKDVELDITGKGAGIAPVPQ